MLKIFILLILFLSCSSNNTLVKKNLSRNVTLVFGRFYDRNPEGRKNTFFTYQLDNDESQFRPRFENNNDFFWFLVDKRTRTITITSFSIGLEGRNGGATIFGENKMPLASVVLPEEANLPVYIGDFVVASESQSNLAKLKDVYIELSPKLAKEYLASKKISDGNYIERKLSFKR